MRRARKEEEKKKKVGSRWNLRYKDRNTKWMALTQFDLLEKNRKIQMLARD